MPIRQTCAHLAEVINHAACADQLTVLLHYSRPAFPAALLPAAPGARRRLGR
jgi:hypothetical protein